MNIKRMLRIAKEQPWWNSYVENVKNRHRSLDEFLKTLDKESRAEDFFSKAFSWVATKERFHFWETVSVETCKKYRDTSVKVFVKDAVFEPVAKSAGLDIKEFTDTLISNKISFDIIETEGKYLVAYKITYKIVEEWI